MPLKIATEVGDATGAGKAWVGFSSVSPKNAESEPEAALQLLSWRFEAEAPPSWGTEPHETDAWQQLSLHVDVRWPLHLIVSQTALEAYNALFQFLLAMKVRAPRTKALCGTQVSLSLSRSFELSFRQVLDPSRLHTALGRRVSNSAKYWMHIVFEGGRRTRQIDAYSSL